MWTVTGKQCKGCKRLFPTEDGRRLVTAGGILIEFPLEEIFTITSLRVEF